MPGDLRVALRRLYKRPIYSALSIAILGIGLGSVMFMLSLVNGLILQPLPFPDVDRLAAVGYMRDRNVGVDEMSGADFLLLRQNLQDVGAIGLYAETSVALRHGGVTRVYSGALLSDHVLSMLDVAPKLGRGFSAGDLRIGAAPVVLLSHTLWRSEFNGDPDLLGSQVRVNGHPATVIGVMPPGFAFPYASRIWLPAIAGGVHDIEGVVIVKTRADTGIHALATQVHALIGQLGEQLEGQRDGRSFVVKPLSFAFVDETTRAYVWLMFGAATLVLLLSCANAANLQLAQTLHRRRDFAVRSALGANRWRLLLEQMVESLLLSTIATILALLVAHVGGRWILNIFTANEQPPPYFIGFGVDLRLLALAVPAAVVTTAIAGILPALHASRGEVQSALRDSDNSAGRGWFVSIGNVLVMGEIALTIVLLVGAGTFIQGLNRMRSMDLGTSTSPDSVLLAAIDLLPGQFQDRNEQVRLIESLVERVRQAPGVKAATTATAIPGVMLDSHETIGATGEGEPANGFPEAQAAGVGNAFLSAYGVTLVAGRWFDGRETSGSQQVVVVDKALAGMLWPDRQVLGQTLEINPDRPAPRRLTVIGVVEELHLDAALEPPMPTLVQPIRQWPASQATIAVQLQGDAAAFVPEMTKLIRASSYDLPILWMHTQARAIEIERISVVVLTEIFTAAGLLALLLASSGLYGVLAFSVARRTREIGIRRALGASNPAVASAAGARLLWQLIIGTGVGILAAVPWSLLLEDPGLRTQGGEFSVLIVAVATVALSAIAAAALPVWRALRVDPIVALRHE